MGEERTFQPLAPAQRDDLLKALKMNATDRKNAVGLTMGRDTSFSGTTTADPTDDEVISLIRSVPCHYAAR